MCCIKKELRRLLIFRIANIHLQYFPIVASLYKEKKRLLAHIFADKNLKRKKKNVPFYGEIHLCDDGVLLNQR